MRKGSKRGISFIVGSSVMLPKFGPLWNGTSIALAAPGFTGKINLTTEAGITKSLSRDGQVVTFAGDHEITAVVASAGGAASGLLFYEPLGIVGKSAHATTLQEAYDASTNPEIIVTAERGGVTIRDNPVPTGLDLLEIQDKDGLALFASGAAQNTLGTDTFPRLTSTSPTTGHSIGSPAFSFKAMHARKLYGVDLTDGTAVISSFYKNQGGLMAGHAYGGELGLGGPGSYYPASCLVGNAYAVAGEGAASLKNRGGGAAMFGWAYAASVDAGKAEIYCHPTAYGAFVGGYAKMRGVGIQRIAADFFGAGSFLWAYVQGTTGSGAATAAARGCFVQGMIEKTVGDGAFLKGAGDGSFSQGLVDGAVGGGISASGKGAFAQGRAEGGGQILASGPGSFARGYATAGADIIASARNAFQLGPGTNALADSVQIGAAGLRFKQTPGAPSGLQNGDCWIASGYIYLRSNGTTRKIDGVDI